MAGGAEIPSREAVSVRLWREVDALGGAENGESYSRGYSEALSDVLAILERRGFTEHADPLDGFSAGVTGQERAIVALAIKLADADDTIARLNREAEDNEGVADQLRAERDAAAANACAERDNLAHVVGTLAWVQAAMDAHRLPAEIAADAWGADSGTVAERWVAHLSERLARIEASAEVLIVARHDLMAEVDQATTAIRATGVDFAGMAGEHVAQLLDRLAAYMKGQDDRIVALGDKLDGLTATEQFDVTKSIDVRQDALLTISVLERFADAGQPFTRGDARRTGRAIRRLLDAHGRARTEFDELGRTVQIVEERLANARHYTDAQRDQALAAMIAFRGLPKTPYSERSWRQMIDAIAKALGMERAS
jgi:hypothetical protein